MSGGFSHADVAFLWSVVRDYDINLRTLREIASEDGDAEHVGQALIARMQGLCDGVVELATRLERELQAQAVAAVDALLGAGAGRSPANMGHGCPALSAVGTAPAPLVMHDEQRGQSASDITIPANPLFCDPALQRLQCDGDASISAQRGATR